MEGISQQLASVHGEDYNESPVQTPLNTRVGSPIHGPSSTHTQVEGHDAINNICLAWKARRANQAVVSDVDGSATVPALVKLRYLAIYFAFNLGLTLYNKGVMIQFPFPYLLTALHAASSFVGTRVLLASGHFTLSHIGGSDSLNLMAFSMLYTVNIAVSNISLAAVTVPFHQVVRATTPIFTILIYRTFFSGTYTLATYVSLLPVIQGVGLATYGDYYATVPGFLATIIGAMLAAVKTVATNRLQTAGIHINAMELLYRMSAPAFVQSLIGASLTGEITAFQEYVLHSGRFGGRDIMILLFNGLIAFGLNIVSFSSNKKVGALTMTVAANVKQVVTIVLAIALWHLHVGWLNAAGIVLTILGGTCYAYVEMRSKETKDRMGRKLEEGVSEKTER